MTAIVASTSCPPALDLAIQLYDLCGTSKKPSGVSDHVANDPRTDNRSPAHGIMRGGPPSGAYPCGDTRSPTALMQTDYAFNLETRIVLSAGVRAGLCRNGRK